MIARVGRRLSFETFVVVALGTWAALVAVAPSLSVKAAAVVPVLIAGAAWWVALAPRRWLAVLFFCLLLVPPLPVLVGDSGLHVAPLAAAAGVAIGVLRITEWRPARGPLPLAFGMLLAVLTASVGLAAVYSGWTIAAGSLARVLLFAIGVYVFFYTLAGPGSEETDSLGTARGLFLIGILAALFACLDFYYQLPAPAGYGPQFVWLDEGVFRRAQGLFYEASTLGNFCTFFLVMIVVALFRPRAQRPCSRAVLIAGAVIFGAALIFSYSRASVVSLLVALCAFYFVGRARAGRTLVTLCACAVVAALVAYVAFPSFANSYWLRVQASFQYMLSAPDGVLSGRLTSWQALVEFVQRKPWHALAGVGYKTLPYSDFIGQTVTPDNMYLSLLVETGVLGLAAFFALNIAILRVGWRAARSARPAAAFFGSWIFCFWTGQLVQMLSGDLLTYWRVLPIYFWVLATAAREVEAEHGNPVR